MSNYSTEFFKTLAEAEAFSPCGVCWKEVYSLDKPGTIKKFKEYRDDAMFWERYRGGFLENEARAVVVFGR